MSYSDDLSGGMLSDIEQDRIEGELNEESERRKWKSGLLWLNLGFVLIGYLAFGVYMGALIYCRGFDFGAPQAIGAAIVGGVPSLLLANLMRLVGTSPRDRRIDQDGSSTESVIRLIVEQSSERS